ncbi:unnamed protein product, partial [marine sediment metagenome]
YLCEKYEAIFVDNGSQDATPEILQKYRDKITILRQPKRGAAAARNTGVKQAKYEYIAFTDSDCVPEAGWLRELALFAKDNSQADFIGGKIISFNRNSNIEMFGEEIFNHKRAIQYYKPPFVITANLLTKKQRLFEIGLFDESFLLGQDVDLALRGLFKHGSQFVYADKAVVRHFNSSTLKALFLKGIKSGQAAAHIWKRYSKEFGRSLLKKCLDVFKRHKLSDEKVKFPLYNAVFDLGRR